MGPETAPCSPTRARICHLIGRGTVVGGSGDPGLTWWTAVARSLAAAHAPLGRAHVARAIHGSTTCEMRGVHNALRADCGAPTEQQKIRSHVRRPTERPSDVNAIRGRVA